MRVRIKTRDNEEDWEHRKFYVEHMPWRWQRIKDRKRELQIRKHKRGTRIDPRLSWDNSATKYTMNCYSGWASLHSCCHRPGTLSGILLLHSDGIKRSCWSVLQSKPWSLPMASGILCKPSDTNKHTTCFHVYSLQSLHSWDTVSLIKDLQANPGECRKGVNIILPEQLLQRLPEPVCL